MLPYATPLFIRHCLYHILQQATLLCCIFLVTTPSLAREEPSAPGGTLPGSSFPVTGEVILNVFDRPPYYAVDKDVVGGFIIDRVRMVFERAGLSARFVALPPKRILATYPALESAACSPGWFRTPEREAQHLLFSHAIYRDMPPVLVIRRSVLVRFANAQIPPSIDQLVTSRLRGVMRSGFSYGALDGIIRTAEERNILRVSVSSRNILEMLAANRGDYTFMEQEEASFLLRREPKLGTELLMFPQSDTATEERHIMCSPATPQEIMQRIDDAVDALAGSPAYEALHP